MKALIPAQTLNAGFLRLLIRNYDYDKIKISKPAKCYLGLFPLA